MVCEVVSTVTSQQEGSGFEPTRQLEPFCVEFACSQTTHMRLTADSKIAHGLNLSVYCMLAL